MGDTLGRLTALHFLLQFFPSDDWRALASVSVLEDKRLHGYSVTPRMPKRLHGYASGNIQRRMGTNIEPMAQSRLFSNTPNVAVKLLWPEMENRIYEVATGAPFGSGVPQINFRNMFFSAE